MEQLIEYIKNWFLNLIGLDLMMAAINENRPIPVQAYINLIYSSITFLIGIFVAYRFIYMMLGLFGKSRKYPDSEPDKKYCFLIPARNEELVIENIIDTIRSMDYPQELVDILVVADNCDEEDKTAELARKKGVYVVERHDPERRSKGYGLQYALEEFRKEHDLVEDYYAYIVLDADNIVAKNYLSKVNSWLKATNVDAGITYRNAKNLSENWIAAMCGMNVYTNVISNQRPRSILNTNQQIYGTGLVLRSHIMKDGWNWTGLTEDLDIEADLTAMNYQIGYCEEAVFYEEEPTKVYMFIRQQMRWTKGGLLTFFKYGGPLLKSFFKKPTWAKYDIFWQIFPYAFLTFYFTLTYQIISLILFLIVGDNGYNWWSFANWLLTLFGTIYISSFVIDLVTVIREWKRFHLNVAKTIIYIFLFPIYQIINLPISAIAGFMNVKWKHIDHHTVVNPDDLKAEEDAKKKK